MSTDLVTRTAEKILLDVIAANKKTLEAILPTQLQGDRFLRLLVGAIRKNQALTQCTPGSFINAVLTATSLGLEIRPNSAYLVPFKSECQLIIDYRGKMDLARRSGKVGVISAKLVHAADKFDYRFDSQTGEHFEFRPAMWAEKDGTRIPLEKDGAGQILLGFGFAEILGAAHFQTTIMLVSEIEAIRKRAASSRSKSPWDTDWEQMALKTILHRLCKGLPQSPELDRSQEVDEAMATGEPLPMIIDLQAPDTPMFTGSRELQERVGQAQIAEAQAAVKQTSRPQEIIDTGAAPILDTSMDGEITGGVTPAPTPADPTEAELLRDQLAQQDPDLVPQSQRPTMEGLAREQSDARSKPGFRRGK